MKISFELSATLISRGYLRECPLDDSSSCCENSSDSKLLACSHSLTALAGIACANNINICKDTLSPLSPRLADACAMKLQSCTAGGNSRMTVFARVATIFASYDLGFVCPGSVMPSMSKTSRFEYPIRSVLPARDSFWIGRFKLPFNRQCPKSACSRINRSSMAKPVSSSGIWCSCDVTLFTWGYGVKPFVGQWRLLSRCPLAASKKVVCIIMLAPPTERVILAQLIPI